MPFKVYPTIEILNLPAEVRQTGIAALSAVAERVPTQSNSVLGLEEIAELLYLSAGITRTRNHPGGKTYFRAAACTGALYEVELNLVGGDLTNLSAGVYHFAAAEFGLRNLRAGDYRRFLLEAAAGELAVAHAPSSSFARASTGAMLGNIRLAHTRISVETTVLC